MSTWGRNIFLSFQNKHIKKTKVKERPVGLITGECRGPGVAGISTAPGRAAFPAPLRSGLTAAHSGSALHSGAGSRGRLGARACALGQSLTSPLRVFLNSEWGTFYPRHRRVGNTAPKRDFYKVFVARGNTSERRSLRR